MRKASQSFKMGLTIDLSLYQGHKIDYVPVIQMQANQPLKTNLFINIFNKFIKTILKIKYIRTLINVNLLMSMLRLTLYCYLCIKIISSCHGMTDIYKNYLYTYGYLCIKIISSCQGITGIYTNYLYTYGYLCIKIISSCHGMTGIYANSNPRLIFNKIHDLPRSK